MPIVNCTSIATTTDTEDFTQTIRILYDNADNNIEQSMYTST